MFIWLASRPRYYVHYARIWILTQPSGDLVSPYHPEGHSLGNVQERQRFNLQDRQVRPKAQQRYPAVGLDRTANLIIGKVKRLSQLISETELYVCSDLGKLEMLDSFHYSGLIGNSQLMIKR